MHITPCFNHLKNLQGISSSLVMIYLAYNGEMHSCLQVLCCTFYYLGVLSTLNQEIGFLCVLHRIDNGKMWRARRSVLCGACLWELVWHIAVPGRCCCTYPVAAVSRMTAEHAQGTVFWNRGTQQAMRRTYVIRMSVVVLEIATTVIRASTITLGDCRRKPNHAPSIPDTSEREETLQWTSEWWEATCDQVLPRSWGVLQLLLFLFLLYYRSALTFPNIWLQSNFEKVA